MNLGFLLFDYFPYGGLQRDCLKLASVCAGRGHQVTVFTRTWQGERPQSVEVELFGRHGFSNVQRNRAWLKQLAVTLPSRRLDRVIGFNKLPNLDVYYGSDPCYVAKTARLRPAWYRWLPRFRHFRQLEQSVFKAGLATRILLLTRHEIPLYQQYYRTESERFEVLPPGITRRAITGAQRLEARRRLRAEHGWKDDEYLLLLVGSGFRVKGVDRAIDALSALPTAWRARTRLLVIGQNRAGEFIQQARRLGVADRVHFLGGRLDVPDWLLAVEVYFHPAYSESAGMILLEAMAAGLPVLTTDTCGYAFHVEKAGGGIVLPSPFEPAACAKALALMLTSEQREFWQKNGLAYAAKEDLYSCHERAADLIEEPVGHLQADERKVIS